MMLFPAAKFAAHVVSICLCRSNKTRQVDASSLAHASLLPVSAKRRMALSAFRAYEARYRTVFSCSMCGLNTSFKGQKIESSASGETSIRELKSGAWPARSAMNAWYAVKSFAMGAPFLLVGLVGTSNHSESVSPRLFTGGAA